MADIIYFFICFVVQTSIYLAGMLYISGSLCIDTFKSKKFLISYPICMAILYFCERISFINLYISLFLMFFSYILFIYINSSNNLHMCISASLLGYLLESLCQIIFIFLHNIFIGSFNVDTPTLKTSVIIILSGILFFLLMRILPIEQILKFVQTYFYLFLNCLVLMVCLLLFSYNIVSTDLNLYLSSDTILLLIVFLLISLVLYIFLTTIKEKQKIEIYETYLPILDNMIKNIRKRQHLYQNQISSIINLTHVQTNYDDLCTALTQFSEISETDKNDVSLLFLHIENKLLASLLYCKVIDAQTQGKNVIPTITKYSYQSNCSAFEIVDIVGILLDNAIESDSENIYITIGNNSSEKFSICIENDGYLANPEFINKIFKSGYTSKKNPEGHGLGLSILKSKIRKYNGDITVGTTYHDEKTYLSIEVEI